MNNDRTNTLLLTVIGVATLLVAVIGASFAYFTATLSGTETGTTVTVGAGTLSIAYASGTPELISTDPLQPNPLLTPVLEKEFTITGNNSTTATMPYTIAMKLTDNTFTNGALAYKLVSTNTGTGTIVASSLDKVPINTGPHTVTFGSGTFTGPTTNAVHSYTLEIYFDDTFENQDEDKDKTFGAYIETTVDEIQLP